MTNEPVSNADEKLRAISRKIAEKEAAESQRKEVEKERNAARQVLYAEAERSIADVLARLRERVLGAAPTASVTGPPGLNIRLGDGVLVVDPLRSAPAEVLAAFDYQAPFDVVAYSAIVVRIPVDRFGYEGRSHSLWFCDAHDEGDYRWFELAYMVQPLIPQRYTLDPFALPPTDSDAAAALTPVMTNRQVAWAPVPFDQDEEQAFIDRWIGWLAAAADRSLSHPRSMPEQSGGRFRFAQERRR